MLLDLRGDGTLFKKLAGNLLGACISTLLAGSLFAATPSDSMAATSSWIGSSVVYTIYPSIFSQSGDLNGITNQLHRIKKLGANVVWIMPITPIGKPVNGHPAFDSPYCVADYYGINTAYGSKGDLVRLVSTAHRLGLKVVLDEVINHSSWDNPLITQHPEFYVHSDNNPKNPNSIVRAFIYNDVAQFNYNNPALRAYIVQMLGYWLTQYHLDGFRFDSADNPPGPRRTIPAAFWRAMAVHLRAVKPDVLMIGEGESGDISNNPFQILYGWDVYYRLKETVGGASAANVVSNWHHEQTLANPAPLLLSLQDDWDFNRDVNTFGGPEGAKAVAVFNLTNNGVPLIYNGMEIGNAEGGVNPHDKIDWTKVNPGFPELYSRLLALRDSSPALQQGKMLWLSNTAPNALLTYKRSAGSQEFLIEINISNQPAQARLSEPIGPNWEEIGTQSGWNAVKESDPSTISLPAKGYAIFKHIRN